VEKIHVNTFTFLETYTTNMRQKCYFIAFCDCKAANNHNEEKLCTKSYTLSGTFSGLIKRWCSVVARERVIVLHCPCIALTLAFRFTMYHKTHIKSSLRSNDTAAAKIHFRELNSLHNLPGPSRNYGKKSDTATESNSKAVRLESTW